MSQLMDSFILSCSDLPIQPVLLNAPVHALSLTFAVIEYGIKVMNVPQAVTPLLSLSTVVNLLSVSPLLSLSTASK